MSETALYRKYRPVNFSEILGQDHIVSVLEESIKSGSIAHSYLFYGSRGTGKTSIARILAREVGCAPEDLYEMDAASNRRIDDIRELSESVRTLPFSSPYKVYIIDEVHMLTKEAFNALLKTLEEPPAHVIFILATTEVEKIPDTVVSRCQSFTFKRPTQSILKDAVAHVAKKEGYTLDEQSTDLIALLGDGSFRDTLVTLQKVLSSVPGKKITSDDVARVTSAPTSGRVNEILTALVDGDVEAGLKTVSQAVENAVDFKLFMKLILTKLRAVLLIRFAPDLKEKLSLDFGEQEMEFLESIAHKANINSATLSEFLEAYTATDRAYLSQLPLELALIKLIGGKKKE